MSKQKKEDGGWAFPGDGQGMTLRDYFAGQVLASMMINHSPGHLIDDKAVADEAYMLADAMLVARKLYQDSGQ